MLIGFLDSGIGGIWVLCEAVKALPCVDYIYYADTLHAPYGNKSSEVVRKIVHEAAGMMFGEYGIDMLVIACNTATSVAVESLRAGCSIPIIGMEPAVKPAVEACREFGKRVLVLATELTLHEVRFRNLVTRVDTGGIVDWIAMQDLVKYADGFDFYGPEPERYIKRMLKDVDLSRYGIVVLGCTHFSFFRDLFGKILPEGLNVIDGTEGIVRRIISIAGDCAESSAGEVSFISTDPGKINADELRKIYESI